MLEMTQSGVRNDRSLCSQSHICNCSGEQGKNQSIVTTPPPTTTGLLMSMAPTTQTTMTKELVEDEDSSPCRMNAGDNPDDTLSHTQHEQCPGTTKPTRPTTTTTTTTIHMMDTSNWKRVMHSYGETDLSLRRNWYSEAAEAYDRLRPNYDHYLEQVLSDSHKKTDSSTGDDATGDRGNRGVCSILEIGCGPGTATMGLLDWFVRLTSQDDKLRRVSLTAIDPNESFCRITRDKVQQRQVSSPKLETVHVQVICQSFEEWEPPSSSCEKSGGIYDYIVAATSIHWIPSHIAFPKIRRLLKPGGRLVILYNYMYQPSRAVVEALQPLYKEYAPELNSSYMERSQHFAPLRNFQHSIQEQEGLRHDGYVEVPEEHNNNGSGGGGSRVFSASEYCEALYTYSPYLKLPKHRREALFAGIIKYIHQYWGGWITVYFVSCYHVATKVPSMTSMASVMSSDSVSSSSSSSQSSVSATAE